MDHGNTVPPAGGRAARSGLGSGSTRASTVPRGDDGSVPRVTGADNTDRGRRRASTSLAQAEARRRRAARAPAERRRRPRRRAWSRVVLTGMWAQTASDIDTQPVLGRQRRCRTRSTDWPTSSRSSARSGGRASSWSCCCFVRWFPRPATSRSPAAVRGSSAWGLDELLGTRSVDGHRRRGAQRERTRVPGRERRRRSPRWPSRSSPYLARPIRRLAVRDGPVRRAGRDVPRDRVRVRRRSAGFGSGSRPARWSTSRSGRRVDGRPPPQVRDALTELGIDTVSVNAGAGGASPHAPSWTPSSRPGRTCASWHTDGISATGSSRPGCGTR